ncbi:MAG: hypothetical protein K2O29_07860, partial [Ruminococcus sp.]|nr:hypothetical protein [Ruminococcus sp.]
YKFSFSVSDGEIPEGISEELKKDYEKINENPKLASVKSIIIGELKLNAEENWTAENKDYSIKLKPTFSEDENGVMVGNFQAEFTLNSTTSFGETLYISATDNCDNTTSETNKVNIRIDKEAPEVGSISINNNLNNGNDENIKIFSGNQLEISARVTDNLSGVDNVSYQYGNKRPVQMKCNDNREYNGILDISENDSTGKIQIIVTDKAGNTENYYCVISPDNRVNVTKNEDEATTIIRDGEAPVVNDVSVSNPVYTDETTGKDWYKDYPVISINSSDNQGIKKISVSINGKVIWKEVTDEFVRTLSGKDEISDEDIKNVLENLKLEFKPIDRDNQKFNVDISGGGDNSVPLVDDKGNTQKFSLESDGKLEVNVVAEDYAENKSSETDNSKAVIYIDNNAPTTNGIINAHYGNISFRQFGTFANEQVTIKVKLSDEKDVNSDIDNTVASSGIKYLKLEFAGKEYNGQIYESEPEWVFFNIPVPDLQGGLKLPENTSISGEMILTGEDNVGNKLISNNNSDGGIKLVNDLHNSSNVIVENKEPVIDCSVKGDNRYDNGRGEVWYSSDVIVECNITDNADGDSGLSKVNFSRSQQRASTKDLTDIGNYMDDNEKKTEYSGKLSTEEGADGEAVFIIEATDNAGNSVNDKIKVNKDITAPSITKFEFYSPVLSRSPVNIIQDKIERFGYFFDSTTVMTVYAEDTNASSGMASIYCRLINSDGTVFKEERVDNPTFEDDMYHAEFEIPEGFKGDILAWAVDNVKNTSKEVSPDGLASENQNRHDSHSAIIIEMPQTEYTDINGLPLYSDNVTASVIIEDDFSGIKTVEWTTSDYDGWQRIDIDDNGNIYGDYDGWSVDRIERNIALSVSNNITVSRDANDDSIIVRITDNSGNVSENEVHFSIDKQAPVISVSGIQQSPEIKYYNSSQQAHIVISERNFSTPVINGSADGGFAEDPDSIRNTDDFRHIKDISYDSDGTYSLEIEDTDLAGNIAARYFSGTFVIDKTAPVLEVEFSKQSGEKADPKKSSYINDIISAKISVEELNFDSSRISVRINNKEYKPTDWKEINGKHMATIPYDEFKEDGEYTVSISGTDLASNSFKSYSASFVIDTESPEIEFSGFETANKGEVSPVIKIEDINLDEYGLKVYRNNKLCEMSYDKVKEVYSFDVSDNNDCITGKWLEKTVDGKVHKEFIFDDFPSDECFDGSYSIDVSASDKAENSRNETRQFSVNRFGSVFKVENIENINGKYLNKAPNISITETNVDKHQEGSEIIVILDKGSVTEQLDETMYDVSEPEMLDDKSGYVYN